MSIKHIIYIKTSLNLEIGAIYIVTVSCYIGASV